MAAHETSMKIGNRELEVLTFIAENPAVSVKVVAEHFHEKEGLTRTTVQRMVDRLIEKGFVDRAGQWGNHRHYASVQPAQVQEALTKRFVDETLQGSIAPFVAYLNGGAKLSAEDIEQLKSLVAKLEEEEK